MKPRIVVLDGDAASRSVIRRTLEEAGHEAFEVGDIGEALRQTDPVEQARILDQFLSAMPDSVYLYDRDLRFLYASPSGFTSLGVEPSDMVGKTTRQLGFPPEIGVVEADVRTVFTTGQPVAGQCRFPTPQGPRDYEYALAPIGDREGNVLSVLSMTRDATERRRTEEALRRGRERLQAIFQRSGIGMTLADLEGRFLQSNPALHSFLGYSAEELRSLTVHQVSHPEDMTKDREKMQDLLAGESDRYQIEKRYIRKDGKVVWGRLTVSLLPGGEDQPHLALGMIEDISGRKAAEERMREERDRAQRYLDLVHVIIVALNALGEVTLINQRGCAVLGYEEAEILGRNWFDVAIPETIRGQVRSVFSQLIAGERELAGQHENPVVTWSGEERLIAWRNTVLTDEEGNITGALSSGEDITESRRSEDALRRSEERYRIVVESQAELICRWRPDGVLTFVNEAYCRYFGKTADELIGHSFMPLIPEEDQEKVEEHFASLSRENPVATHEHRVIASSADMRWLRWTNRAMFNSDGHLTEYQSVGLDVTDRRRAEEALRASEARLRATLESVPFDFFIIGESGRYIMQNSTCRRHWGDVVGKRPRDLDVADDALALWEENNARAFRGELVEGEVTVGTNEGPRTFYSIISPIHDDGQIRGILGVNIDITGRRQAEDALRHSEEQLRQAQKMEAVGRLAGGIAHDFNNVLMVVDGQCNLLLRRLAQDDANRRGVEEIKTAAERAAGLTRQLLTFSRRQVLKPVVLDINDVIRDVEKMLGRVLGEDIEVVAELAPSPLPARIDHGQLEQVLLNLAVNSRDAMPRGGRLLLETAEMVLEEDAGMPVKGMEPGEYVVISVADTGCGMSEETLAQIFEPFFTTKDQSEGTGLGLSMVYGIIRQSGGRIRVSSGPGEGTEFMIYLPKAEFDANGPVSAADAVPGMPQGRETVLLVEDEGALRRLARVYLVMTGYTVVEASDGQEAIRLAGLHEGPIDLLVTDVVMPGMSGRELSERLSVSRPELKTLFMSGHTERALQDHGISEHERILWKPFSPEALAAKVREVLDGV